MTIPLALLLARRACVLWGLVHLVVLAVALAAGMPPEDSLTPVLPIAVALVFAIDLARRGERTLLANLGVGLPTVLGIATAAAVAAEAALHVALGAIAE